MSETEIQLLILILYWRLRWRNSNPDVGMLSVRAELDAIMPELPVGPTEQEQGQIIIAASAKLHRWMKT